MATTTYVNKRTAHRWRLLALMLAGLFFAFGSFWLLQVMRGDAGSANVNQDQNQIDLIGNVDISRPGSKTSQPLRIRTEALTVLPDEEILKTDKPIEMKLGAASVTGVGMVANNATQQLTLGGRGRIIYPPRAAR